MADPQTLPSRKIITAQTMDEAKAAAYATGPQTELVILGLSENATVTELTRTVGREGVIGIVIGLLLAAA